ncbi:MAG: hypothetical protein JNJ61_19690 [Anaerolineae bacterium]|nr:hypothetical protein [Anaerolineae bacterium]
MTDLLPITFTNVPVPFSSDLYWWLWLNKCRVDDFVAHSRPYESAYLAWEFVRKSNNPFFAEGTGFEGYFVGVAPSTEAVLEALIQIGHGVLESIARSFRLEYGVRDRMMRGLLEDDADFKAIQIWAEQFGAVVGRLRCNLQHNPDGDMFRIQSYRVVSGLRPISYHQVNEHIVQTYSVGRRFLPPRPQIELNGLKPCDQEAWLVIWQIGRFGHPLVREYLQYRMR